MKKIQVLNENINSIKPGHSVWWLDGNKKCREGIMTKEGAVFAFDKSIFASVTLTGPELKSCWPTKVDCIRAEMQRCDEQTKAYEADMNSIYTLIQFLWEHMDKNDKEAVTAVKNRAKELLGIELKGE